MEWLCLIIALCPIVAMLVCAWRHTRGERAYIRVAFVVGCLICICISMMCMSIDDL